MSNRITSTFAIFGNYQMLTASEALLRETFKACDCKIEQEQTQPGMFAKRYIFRGGNIAIIVRPFRIDMEFGYQPNQTIEDFINFIKPTLILLDHIGADRANRVAYSCVEIVDNTNNKTVAKLSDIFGCSNVFGTQAQEFNLRANNPTKINDEIVNSVVLMQDGRITNNQTKATQQVVFINKDINTLINLTEERFVVKDIEPFLRDMIEESDNKTALIEAKLV